MSAHLLYWEGAHASWWQHSMCALAEQMNMMMMNVKLKLKPMIQLKIL